MWVFTKFPMNKDELETPLQRKADRFEGVACPPRKVRSKCQKRGSKRLRASSVPARRPSSEH
jgi:hypothetical protein